eukprot:303941_1
MHHIIADYKEKIRIKKEDEKWYRGQTKYLLSNESMVPGLAVISTTSVGAYAGGFVTLAFCPACGIIGGAIGIVAAGAATAGMDNAIMKHFRSVIKNQQTTLRGEIDNLQNELEQLELKPKKRMKECRKNFEEILLMSKQLCITTPSFQQKLKEFGETLKWKKEL